MNLGQPLIKGSANDIADIKIKDVNISIKTKNRYSFANIGIVKIFDYNGYTTGKFNDNRSDFIFDMFGIKKELYIDVFNNISLGLQSTTYTDNNPKFNKSKLEYFLQSRYKSRLLGSTSKVYKCR